MKKRAFLLGALLAVWLVPSFAQAEHQWSKRRNCRVSAKAPADCCKPTAVCLHSCNACKPNICIIPGPPVCHSIQPCMAPQMGFPMHPYVRSPRDFFMMEP